MSIEINSTLIELWLLNSILAYSAYIVLTGGAFSFAYVAFIAVGAYTAANLTVKHGHNILWGVVAAPVISAVVALVLAKPLERLSGVYLAIASISVVGIVQVLLVNWTKLTGGPLGIAGIPLVLEPWHLALVVIAIALTVRQLERSNLGRAIRMTRLDPIVAGTMGVDVRRVRLWLFVGSAVLGSWAGVLRAHYFGFVTPDDYGFNLVILLLAMVIIGGVGSWIGPVIGAAIFTLLPEWLRDLGDWQDLMTGVLLLVIIIFSREGVVGAVKIFWHKQVVRRRRGMSPAALAAYDGPAQDEPAQPAATSGGPNA
jgi:branched-chain amino acid transport system permease protein